MKEFPEGLDRHYSGNPFLHSHQPPVRVKVLDLKRSVFSDFCVTLLQAAGIGTLHHKQAGEKKKKKNDLADVVRLLVDTPYESPHEYVGPMRERIYNYPNINSRT